VAWWENQLDVDRARRVLAGEPMTMDQLEAAE
jgi:hypothetical protein